MRHTKLRVVVDTDDGIPVGLSEGPLARSEFPCVGLRLVEDDNDDDNPEDAA
jgi:hypothetical protein